MLANRKLERKPRNSYHRVCGAILSSLAALAAGCVGGYVEGNEAYGEESAEIRSAEGVEAGAKTSYGAAEVALGTGSLRVHARLGLPSPASTNDPDSYLSVKAGYVLSYNSSRKVPNWVSWKLDSSYLGTIDRQDDFRVDSTVPSTLPQAVLADYTNTGYDRGHMVPSADRTATAGANSETFYLTNMVPQAPSNNRGPWAGLESYSRSLARSGKELFIIAGGTFSASSLTIGSGVNVPDRTFKVIVVLDAPGQGPRAVTAGTRVIGVLVPNDDSEISASASWRNFRVPVDTIEALTGHDYLSEVAPAVQAVVESRVDNL